MLFALASQEARCLLLRFALHALSALVSIWALVKGFDSRFVAGLGSTGGGRLSPPGWLTVWVAATAASPPGHPDTFRQRTPG